MNFEVCSMQHNLSSWASIMCSAVLHQHMPSGDFSQQCGENIYAERALEKSKKKRTGEKQ
jgi:hypothetical protein